MEISTRLDGSKAPLMVLTSYSKFHLRSMFSASSNHTHPSMTAFPPSINKICEQLGTLPEKVRLKIENLVHSPTPRVVQLVFRSHYVRGTFADTRKSELNPQPKHTHLNRPGLQPKHIMDQGYADLVIVLENPPQVPPLVPSKRIFRNLASFYMFGSRIPFPSNIDNINTCSFKFHPDFDMLYIAPHWSQLQGWKSGAVWEIHAILDSLRRANILNRIRSLAIDVEQYNYTELVSFFAACNHLELVFLVVNHHYPGFPTGKGPSDPYKQRVSFKAHPNQSIPICIAVAPYQDSISYLRTIQEDVSRRRLEYRKMLARYKSGREPQLWEKIAKAAFRNEYIDAYREFRVPNLAPQMFLVEAVLDADRIATAKFLEPARRFGPSYRSERRDPVTGWVTAQTQIERVLHTSTIPPVRFPGPLFPPPLPQGEGKPLPNATLQHAVLPDPQSNGGVSPSGVQQYPLPSAPTPSQSFSPSGTQECTVSLFPHENQNLLPSDSQQPMLSAVSHSDGGFLANNVQQDTTPAGHFDDTSTDDVNNLAGVGTENTDDDEDGDADDNDDYDEWWRRARI